MTPKELLELKIPAMEMKLERECKTSFPAMVEFVQQARLMHVEGKINIYDWFTVLQNIISIYELTLEVKSIFEGKQLDLFLSRNKN